ncbi:hypothetical protein [Labrys sp. KNU-23]|uniref:hypothetical protein n=1 Tax=Labrys sp. KNU-23 TaxID=2789216 RepID=UPI00165B8C79|nr:hypothetical protein [Labrys sp. KNU-23]
MVETLPCGQVLAGYRYCATASVLLRAHARALPVGPVLVGGKFLRFVQMGLAT